MIQLPQKFEEILKLDTSGYYAGAVNITRSKFDQVFSENKLYFFEEYTDHGINHINSVLKACADIITKDTYKLLSEKDISILVLSVFLHDLGMHLQPLTFKKMVTGGYDDVLNTDFGDQKWSVLWDNYLFEAKKFNDLQRVNIFGDSSIYVTDPDLANPDTLTGIHKKLIGEFIRRHHPRIAFELAFKGLTTHEETQIDFCSDFDYKHKLLAGLLARSHGMNMRDTFPILEKHFTKRVWRRPINVHIVYLMALLRLADYFQIDASRVLKVPYLTRQFKSPVSFTEHQKHLQTTFIQETDDDSETLYITTEPSNSTYFLTLERLFNDIQKEVDNTWAVLGEVYGSKPYEEQPKLAYRRIRSNIDDKKSFEATVPYIPEKISFTVDKEIPKLLVGPLYDYDPSFGVRELLQNAVDACWEREYYEKEKGGAYEGAISIKIEPLNDQYVFSIIDNGKGMTLDEIKNYFFKVGGSFRKSVQWQHDHVDVDGHSNVNKSGRFGIGVLAAYLLGTEIEVKTKGIFSAEGYTFKTALDQEQVEITKEKDLHYGTIITIAISKEQFSKLVKTDKGSDGNGEVKAIRFDKWFVLDSPSVSYQFPGCEQSIDKVEKESLENYFPNIINYDLNWHEIVDVDYKRIVWSYYNKIKETIICNGFVVPNTYELEDSDLIAPTLIVYDNDAKLPMNLNRTKVDLPRELSNQLVIDIYKEILAAALIKRIENIFVTQTISSCKIYHPAFDRAHDYDFGKHYNPLNLIFCKDGYYLNLPNSKNLSFTGLKHLKIYKYKHNLDDSLRLKYLFEDSDVDLISVYDLSKYIKKDREAADFMVTAYLLLNRNEVIGVSKGMFSKSRKELQDLSRFERDIQREFVNDESDKIGLIYFKYTNPKNKEDLLSVTVSDLLGDDLIIPYNIEDRKKKFPKAFKELEPYMRKYLEKK